MRRNLQTMIRDLGRRRGRERRGLALAEGVRLVEEALTARVPIRAALVSPALQATERGQRLQTALVAARVELEELSDAELTKLAATEQPQGIVVVVDLESKALADIPVAPDCVVIVLDAIQDPGNVGTMIRTAFALGAAGMIALPGTAEVSNPKTLRATMGAVFRLPVVTASEADAIEWLARERLTVVTATTAGRPLDLTPIPKPLALVLGNEGQGARSAVARSASVEVRIPLVPEAESLNVAVAMGILLYGVTRAR